MLVFGVFVNYYLATFQKKQAARHIFQALFGFGGRRLIAHTAHLQKKRQKRPRQQNIYPEGIRHMLHCFPRVCFHNIANHIRIYIYAVNKHIIVGRRRA